MFNVNSESGGRCVCLLHGSGQKIMKVKLIDQSGFYWRLIQPAASTSEVTTVWDCQISVVIIIIIIMTEDQLVEHEKSDKIEIFYRSVPITGCNGVVDSISQLSLWSSLSKQTPHGSYAVRCFLNWSAVVHFHPFSCFAENLQRNLMQKCWQMKLNWSVGKLEYRGWSKKVGNCYFFLFKSIMQQSGLSWQCVPYKCLYYYYIIIIINN